MLNAWWVLNKIYFNQGNTYHEIEFSGLRVRV